VDSCLRRREGAATAAAAGASIETVASGPGVVAVRLSKESF